MELITGNITIKHILQHNNNWQRFYEKHSHLIRDDIVWNINKILDCRTEKLGFHRYECLDCGQIVTVPHTCKSRLCSSCGTVATDNWIASSLNEFLDVPYQHLIFTIPELIRVIILYNRKILLDLLFKSAAKTIRIWTQKHKSYIPGISMTLHTFGRDLKFNPHIHMLVTCGGLSLDYSKWISNFFIPEQVLKPIWRYQIVDSLRKFFKKQLLSLPQNHEFSNYKSFNKFLDSLYDKIWYVYIGKRLSNISFTLQYIGRYTKRPVIAETRITAYDGQYVEFYFEDHATSQTLNLKLTVEEFIARLIRHIPDKNFRQIRYAGIFATRVRTKLLSIARNLLNQLKKLPRKILSWRDRRIKDNGHDPLLCPACGTEMILTMIRCLKNGQLETVYCHSP
jgi:predicted RNA-binding Zn-ribbon protein involved in translation (DUF1610 family)